MPKQQRKKIFWSRHIRRVSRNNATPHFWRIFFFLFGIITKISWFQIFSLLWMLSYFFWTNLRRLDLMCRRFGTSCSILTNAPQRRHLKFGLWGFTQMKEYILLKRFYKFRLWLKSEKNNGHFIANLRTFMIWRVVGLCEWDKLWWLWQRAEVEEKVEDRSLRIENNRYIAVVFISI